MTMIKTAKEYGSLLRSGGVATVGTVSSRSRDACRTVILACEMIEDEVAAGAGVAARRSRAAHRLDGERPARPSRDASGAALQELIRSARRRGSRRASPSTCRRYGPGGARRPSGARRSSVGPVERGDPCPRLLRQAPSRVWVAENLTLVFPRVDDCVSLLLNDGCVREEIPRNPRATTSPEGWFSHESSLTQSFDEWDERYGRSAQPSCARPCSRATSESASSTPRPTRSRSASSRARTWRSDLEPGPRRRAAARSSCWSGCSRGRETARSSWCRPKRRSASTICSAERGQDIKWRLEYSAPARK